LATEIVKAVVGEITALRQKRTKRQQLKSRMALHAFQLAFTAKHALESWEVSRKEFEKLGIQRPIAPDTTRLDAHSDEQLKTDVLELADEHPTQVSEYLQLLEIRDRTKQAFEFEQSMYGQETSFYSFPSTRTLLHGLLAYSIRTLADLSQLLPRRKLPWRRVARTDFLTAVENLSQDWGQIRVPATDETRIEQLVALARKQGWEVTRRDSAGPSTDQQNPPLDQ